MKKKEKKNRREENEDTKEVTKKTKKEHKRREQRREERKEKEKIFFAILRMRCFKLLALGMGCRRRPSGNQDGHGQ